MSTLKLNNSALVRLKRPQLFGGAKRQLYIKRDDQLGLEGSKARKLYALAQLPQLPEALRAGVVTESSMYAPAGVAMARLCQAKQWPLTIVTYDDVATCSSPLRLHMEQLGAVFVQAPDRNAFADHSRSLAAGNGTDQPRRLYVPWGCNGPLAAPGVRQLALELHQQLKSHSDVRSVAPPSARGGALAFPRDDGSPESSYAILIFHFFFCHSFLFSNRKHFTIGLPTSQGGLAYLLHTFLRQIDPSGMQYTVATVSCALTVKAVMYGMEKLRRECVRLVNEPDPDSDFELVAKTLPSSAARELREAVEVVAAMPPVSRSVETQAFSADTQLHLLDPQQFGIGLSFATLDLDLWKLRANHVINHIASLDYIYAPRTLRVLDGVLQRAENFGFQRRTHLVYIHTGGLSGNEDMREKYLQKWDEVNKQEPASGSGQVKGSESEGEAPGKIGQLRSPAPSMTAEASRSSGGDDGLSAS